MKSNTLSLLSQKPIMDPNFIEAQLCGIFWPVKSILSRKNKHYTFYITKSQQHFKWVPSVSYRRLDTLSATGYFLPYPWEKPGLLSVSTFPKSCCCCCRRISFSSSFTSSSTGRPRTLSIQATSMPPSTLGLLGTLHPTSQLYNPLST